MTTPDERTGLYILSEDECWSLLRSTRIGRIAVCVGSHPDIFPVNYAMDGDDIVVLTLPGLKLAAAVLGRSVTFEIDHFDTEKRSGWSVVVHGTGTEAEGTDEIVHCEQLGIEPWADAPRYRYLRIAASSIAGRRVGAD